MITYLNHIRDTRTQRCDVATWHALTTSEQTAMHINEYRKTKNIDWKQRLAAVNFQGYDPATLSGDIGSRKQNDLVPTGLFMLDVDHLSQMKRPMKPSQAYNLLLTVLPKLNKGYSPSPQPSPKGEGVDTTEQLDATMAGGIKAPLPVRGGAGGEAVLANVALVHTTPSGDGLRIVMKGRKGSTIHDDQKWLADAMGIDFDACTKDLSRWSFVPAMSDIFYQNDELLFGDPLLTYSPSPQPSPQGEGVDTTEQLEAPMPRYQQGDLFEETSAPSGRFVTEYKGVPYTEIVSRYLKATGTPVEGERHATMVQMALDFRTICDNNVDWLLEVVPTMGKTRTELKNICQWAVGQAPKPASKRLKRILEEIQEPEDEYIDNDAINSSPSGEAGRGAAPALPSRLPKLVKLLTSKVMPFQRPAVAMMCFPALQTHVANAYFVGLDRKKFRLSGMCVLAAKQSSGKGCVDDPIDEIMRTIKQEDKNARERERAWAESQQNKKANEKGAERPKVVIRYLNSDTTPAALLQRLFAAEHYGAVPHQFTFTKVEEIEYLYAMAPTAGKARVSQLIRSCWDCARMGSERFTSSAANFDTELAWNWTACGTIENVKRFFGGSTSNGTVSRVDFCTLIPPEEDFDFAYGVYDKKWREALSSYIANLQNFRCETYGDDVVVPFHYKKIDELEAQMNAYIKRHAKEMENDTWKSFAWRAKVSALKKILTLFIANGQKWESSFVDFAWWSFHYSMWCKMNLFYETACEAFKSENIKPAPGSGSVLDLLPETFTRADFYEAMQRGGFKSPPYVLLYNLVKRERLIKAGNDIFQKLE